MADKIVVLHDGKVEQIGAPLDLYDRPANLFVAGFIGSPAMNVLKGRIAAGAKPMFKAENGIEMPLASAPQASDGRPASYGFRPEHLRLASDGVPAEVVVIEPTGSETQVMLKLGGADIVAVFRDRVAAKPGEIIKIAPDTASVHLFDGESGQRLAA
jgi:multiple sugar transport system ATP-binding protein